MAVVLVPIIFRGPTQGESSIPVPASTVGECFDLVEEKHPGLREMVIDPATGQIHRFVKVTLNGVLLDRGVDALATPVSEDDEIEVIAAVAGG